MSTSKNKIKELHPLKSILEEDISNNQILMLLPQKDIFLSENHMGINILLENNLSSAFKYGSDDHQMILADRGYKSGRHYCEFIFETEPTEKAIIIGVCLMRNDFNFSVADPKGFWGFIPSDCKKIGYNDKGTLDKGEYGAICKIGDAVGIMMEFSSNGIDLSFYINKIHLGIAFKSLPFQTYYPCAILGYDSSRIQIINNALFPDLE